MSDPVSIPGWLRYKTDKGMDAAVRADHVVEFESVVRPDGKPYVKILVKQDDANVGTSRASSEPIDELIARHDAFSGWTSKNKDNDKAKEPIARESGSPPVDPSPPAPSNVNVSPIINPVVKSVPMSAPPAGKS